MLQLESGIQLQRRHVLQQKCGKHTGESPYNNAAIMVCSDNSTSLIQDDRIGS